VHAQIAEFVDYAGGFGHLLSMGQAGFLSHADTVDSMTLFGKEVLPRLKAHRQPAIEAPDHPRNSPAAWLSQSLSARNRCSARGRLQRRIARKPAVNDFANRALGEPAGT
jgi:hypothetical protein